MLAVVVLVLLHILSFTDAKFYEELNKDNFHTFLENHETVLVKFYAEWCGHCKHLAPEYERAAEVLKKEGVPVSLVKLNCPENESVCQEFGVTGYPTLKLFKKGVFFEDCSGKRSGDAIINHMRIMAGPSLTEITTEEEFLKLRSGQSSLFFAALKSKSDDLFKMFKSVSEMKFKSFKFGYSENQDLLKSLGLKNGVYRFLPTMIQSKLEPKFVEITDFSSQKSFEDWISKEWHGDLAYRTQDNEELIGKKPLSVLYFRLNYERDPKGTNYIRNRCLKVILSIKSELPEMTFAMSDSMQFYHEVTQFGADISEDRKMPIVTIKDQNGKKYIMTGDFSWEAMKKFYMDFKANKLEPYVKSEPLPENNSNPVKTVVAKNFDSIVNDPTKDVFIEFYSPNCGHCQRLKPTYEALGEALVDESGVLIANMDATQNDIPKEYVVNGFPTMYFVKKGMKNMPIPYNGGREKEDFLKFIASNASDKLKGFDKNGKPVKSEL